MPADPPVTSPFIGSDVITSPSFEEEPIINSTPEGNTPAIINPPDSLPPETDPPDTSPPEPDKTVKKELPTRGQENTSFVEGNIKVDKLSPLQRAGLNLAIGVGSVITLVILVVLAQAVYLMFHPQTSSVFASQDKFENVLKENANSLNSANADDKARADNNIKQARQNVDEALLNDSTWHRITSLFDLVAVKALLPIFTTILGYIFGSRLGSEP